MTIRVCPNCDRSDSLWIGVDVIGAIGMNERGEPDGDVAEVQDLTKWEPDGHMGCGNCDWMGTWEWPDEDEEETP